MFTELLNYFLEKLNIFNIERLISAEINAREKWVQNKINRTAATVEDYFHKFEYVITVDPEKVLEVGSYHTVPEFKEYEYPNRSLEDCVFVRCFRVAERNLYDGKTYFDEIWSEDLLFVATNNKYDALMIALKFK